MALAVLLVTACSSPTAGGGSGAAPAQQGGSTESGGPSLNSVLAEVEGLADEERRARLAEMAAEAGPLNFYTSNTDASELIESFTDTYDIEVSTYRANGDVVLQRIVQESQAGFAGSDLVDTDMLRMVALDEREGLLAPYQGPATEGMPDDTVFPGWTATRLNVFVTGQNTDVVPAGQRPASYEDLADDAYAGKVMMEPRAAEWFVTLYRYFEEHGMEPDAIEAMFEGMASNATVIEGNTVQGELLAAGEHGIAASTYSHTVDQLAADGAPVTWRPPLEPTVVRPNGIGILKSSRNPAGALLLYEWFLTDAQALIADVQRVPARPEAQQGVLDGIPTVNVAADEMITDGERWEQRYEQILRAAVQQAPSN
ncbi:MAG: ABC transporter substrate-binding protein [Egibacteraceae bacterium]